MSKTNIVENFRGGAGRPGPRPSAPRLGLGLGAPVGSGTGICPGCGLPRPPINAIYPYPVYPRGYGIGGWYNSPYSYYPEYAPLYSSCYEKKGDTNMFLGCYTDCEGSVEKDKFRTFDECCLDARDKNSPKYNFANGGNCL